VSDGLNRTPLWDSELRPDHWFGAERQPALFTLSLSATLIFIGMSWYTVLLGIAFWLVVMAFLRQMAKSHPQMTRVYQRYTKYRDYYPGVEKLPLPRPWNVLRK